MNKFILFIEALLLCMLCACNDSTQDDASIDSTTSVHSDEADTDLDPLNSSDTDLDSSENHNFIITEDAIYSADGKTLYKYTGGESFDMPDEVMFIAPNAFVNSEIKQVDFSDSLLFIGSFAFDGTHIESVYLPESVIEIDAFAFYTCLDATEGYIPSGCHVIDGFRDYTGFVNTPFYCEKYNDTVFPTEPIIRDDCIFMSRERKYSPNSPGSDDDSPKNYLELYYAESNLNEIPQVVFFKLISDSEAAMLFRGWYGRTDVFITTDGGVTWQETPTRPSPVYLNNNILVDSIWLDTQAGLLIYYQTYSGSYLYGPDEVLTQITLDGGKSWQLILRGDLKSDKYKSGYLDILHDSIDLKCVDGEYTLIFSYDGYIVGEWKLEPYTAFRVSQ